MVAMTTQRALLQFTALAALVLAPVAAARLIAPEGMWASEPYLELAHRDIPDLLVRRAILTLTIAQPAPIFLASGFSLRVDGQQDPR